MSKKLFAACLVIAAFAVVPSLASANPILTQPTGTPMAAGSAITATNVGETLLETSTGTLRCTTAILTGKLLSNATATGAKGEIETAKFGGTGAKQTETAEPECTGSNFFTPNTTVTPGKSLPWCLEAGAGDTFTVTGSGCAVKGPITFELDVTGIGTCKYERAAAVPGTVVTHGAGANENTLTILNVPFPWEAPPASPELCPKEGKLTMRFSLTSGGNPVFISP